MRALVAYVKQFSPRFAAEHPDPVPATRQVVASPESIQKGRAAYDSLACGACHGDGGTGADAVAGGMKDDWGNDVYAPNLTEPWSFRGGRTAADVYLRLKTASTHPDAVVRRYRKGRRPLARGQLRRVAGAEAVWEMTADELKAHYASQAKRHADNPSSAAGRWWPRWRAAIATRPSIAKDAGCRAWPFAGGMKMRLVVWGDVVSANLTRTTKRASAATATMTSSARSRGASSTTVPACCPSDGWPAYAHLTPQDQGAIVGTCGRFRR